MNTSIVNFVTKSRKEFRSYYMQENLKNLSVLSLILSVLNIVFRLFSFVFPDNITRIHNFPEFDLLNWVSIFLFPAIYIITRYYYKRLLTTGVAVPAMERLVVIAALLIILNGMLVSFVVTYIPSDNLITFMLALTVTCVMFVFNQSTNWLISVFTAVVFSVLLIMASRNPTEILYNEVICLILLVGFFFMARYNYSYKANHFLQLVEINKNKIEIEKASNFKNEVLGMVAHDLRNPIAAIESLTMLMEMSAEDDDTLENLDMMKQSCGKARAIINDLIEVAKNDNSASFEVQRTDMNTTLQGIVHMWDSIAGMRGRVIFRNDYGAAYAYINLEKFQRVIDNLITNAAKFSSEQEKIDLILSKSGGQLIIEVRDYGVGIPEKMLPLIFERFSKAGRAGLRGEHSTGLGLSIVKQIVEKHNGTIAVSSTEGSGSVFTIALPEVK